MMTPLRVAQVSVVTSESRPTFNRQRPVFELLKVAGDRDVGCVVAEQHTPVPSTFKVFSPYRVKVAEGEGCCSVGCGDDPHLFNEEGEALARSPTPTLVFHISTPVQPC